MNLNKLLAPSLAFSIFNPTLGIEQIQPNKFESLNQQTALIAETKPAQTKVEKKLQINIEKKPFSFTKQNFEKRLSSNVEIGFSNVDQAYSVSFGLVNDKIVGIIGEGENPALNPAQSPQQIKEVYEVIEQIISSNPISTEFRVWEPVIIISKDSDGKDIAIFEINKITPSDVFDRLRSKLLSL